MSNETLFYICGIALAVSAVAVSLLGLKLKDFPGRALPLVVLWFAIFVGGATTFAVLHGKDEDKAKAAELEKAGKQIEEDQTVNPYKNEGAQGGETEKAEEEAEEGAEGSVQGEEPVGPTEGEGSSEGGGGSSGSTGAGAEGAGSAAAGPGGTLHLAASKTALAFDKEQLTSKPGKVTIDFDNPSAIAHNVVIEKDGKELAGFEPIAEGEEEVSAELEPGTYTFLCTVPGHAEAGMEGTLVVK